MSAEVNYVGDAKVIVYSAPTCPWCTTAKEFLQEKGIQFEDKDISTDEAARNEMMQKSGQSGVPVLDINGKIIVGFNAAAIENALKG